MGFPFWEQYQKRRSQEKRMPSSECIKVNFLAPVATSLSYAEWLLIIKRLKHKSISAHPVQSQLCLRSVRAVINTQVKLREAEAMSNMRRT